MPSTVAALAVVDARLRNTTQERIPNKRTAPGLAMPPVGHYNYILALAAYTAQALFVVPSRHQAVSRPCLPASLSGKEGRGNLHFAE